MSIRVPVSELSSTVPNDAWCYFVTYGTAGAHVLSLRPRWVNGSDMLFAITGGRGRENSLANGSATLVFAPLAEGDLEGYSLIVDVAVSASDDDVLCTATNAVWHRPAPDVEPQ